MPVKAPNTAAEMPPNIERAGAFSTITPGILCRFQAVASNLAWNLRGPVWRWRRS